MKRALAVFLILIMLLPSSVLADRAPSAAAITIDGIRTAFFDEAGAYLPPILENGVVYVPLLAFAQSADLSLTVEGNAYALTRSAQALYAENEKQ